MVHEGIHGNKRRAAKFFLMAVLIGAGFVVASPAHAQILDAFFIRVFGLFIYPFVQILNGLVYVLIKVAQYNDFMTEPIVVKGWTTMRDVANMFFVFVLLIIAIGTIVKWQVINYRQNLRRLILMALLINFSRTIVVFFIDLSQVIVLTFISAVEQALQGGIIQLFGIDQVVSTAGLAPGLVTFIVAIIVVLVSCIVVAVITIIFVVRIIALWLIIIFAPMAFLLSALPQTEKYYKMWWDKLGTNISVGPVLAFMLWLVFSIVSENQGGQISPNIDPNTIAAIGGIAGSVLINFMVGVGLLVASIGMASKMGAAGGSMAQKFGEANVGRLKAVGARFAVGKSGQGGVVGLARTAGVTALTRPADTLRTIARPVTSAAVGVAAGVARVASTVGTLSFARGRRAGTAVRRGAARVGERYERTTGAIREAYETGEGLAATAARRGLGRLEFGERQAARARVKAEAPRAGEMSYNQQVDVLRSPAIIPSRKAAIALDMIRDGERMDQLERENPELARRVKQAAYEHGGLSPDDKKSLEDKNLRHSNLTPEQLEQRVKTMHTEGKSFSRGDLLHENTASLITRLASQTLSGVEFKKFIDKLPKESKSFATAGLKQALEGLVMEPVAGKTGVARGEAEKRNAAITNDREKIREQMIKLDPNSIREFSRDFVEKAGRVQFSDAEASDASIAENVRKLGVKQIGAMSPEELENVGKHFTATTIIKAENHEDVTAAQSEAMQRGVAVNFNEGDSSIRATFQSIIKNNLTGPRFASMIEDNYKKEGGPENEKNKFKKAFAYLQKLIGEEKGKKKADGEGQTPSDFEQQGLDTFGRPFKQPPDTSGT